MDVKKSVFGSNAERELYKSISSEWSEKFNIWPGLSFLGIFDLNQIQLKLKPSPKQVGFLKMTTVDITVCKMETDEPILSIEFDGMCRGYSRLGKYVQIHNSPDVPMRKQKMDLKLQVAETFGYPFFIVSYNEKNPIGEDLHLTIVDGIIGQCLAKKDTKTLIEEELERQREYLDALPPDELQMVFQDIVISSEVEAEFLHDPIVNKTAEYSTKLRKSDIALPGFSYEYLQHPEPPSLSGEYPNADELRARIESINKADQVGCRYTLNFRQKDFEETVWVRNIRGFYVSPTSIAHNLSELLAYKKACDYFLGGDSKSPSIRNPGTRGGP